jgi:UDP-N-acetylmuramyl pentapeptide synthase
MHSTYSKKLQHPFILNKKRHSTSNKKLQKSNTTHFDQNKLPKIQSKTPKSNTTHFNQKKTQKFQLGNISSNRREPSKTNSNDNKEERERKTPIFLLFATNIPFFRSKNAEYYNDKWSSENE